MLILNPFSLDKYRLKSRVSKGFDKCSTFKFLLATFKSYYRHLKERLIEETKSIVEKNLLRERNELIVRMQKKVNFLKEDQAEIRRDLDDNGGVVSDIIERVKLEGSIIDADKLQLHIDELESVTSLMTVLRVRLKTTENKVEVTKDQREKVGFHNYNLYVKC